jgi:hypothetical protein
MLAAVQATCLAARGRVTKDKVVQKLRTKLMDGNNEVFG